MKKKILIMLMAVLGTTAVMNAQQTDVKCAKATKCETKCTKPNKCSRSLCAGAFEGITLNDSQKAAIAKIDSNYYAKAREARTANRDARKDMRKEQRAQRMTTDSAARADRMQRRLAYLREFQKVLTPEQYVTFLENTAVQAANPGKAFRSGHKDMRNGGKDKKGGKDMRKGFRGPNRNAAAGDKVATR